ncbi:acyl-CoA dehydrogenase family protein [Hydrogenophaga sp. T2]|uniref:acyl-CoA dehydrogenase family protein n=1 Tax=Hydrogenophaga sp. T2 TaxID=3132823 RepID=UPI003CF4AD0E
MNWTAEDTTALLDTVARFAREALVPHVNDWDAQATFPRALYREAARIGLPGLGYPEHLGGTPAPWRARNAVSQLLARRTASGGLLASLFSHNIGLPPILHHGSVELQAEVIPPVLRGEQIAALGITEPGGGSDVARLRTTARLDGGDYVIDGEKTFITSGLRCDWITLAVRTDPLNQGAGGISLIAVPCDAPGLSRTALHKMGWHASDTAHLRFDGVRVPARCLIGQAHQGFRMIMGNFNGERLAMSALALGFAEACHDEAQAWARERKTFGQALVEHQVVRHKLMDMRMRIASTQHWLDALGDRADAGDHSPDWVGQVCLLKNHSTQAMQANADAAVQILGGMGFMRGTASERIYREVKVMMIGGGAEEIMKELAARQFGP